MKFLKRQRPGSRRPALEQSCSLWGAVGAEEEGCSAKALMCSISQHMVKTLYLGFFICKIGMRISTS